jgi:hypothetical protein
MKFIYLFFVTFTITITTSQAQNAFPATGNVGIGTSSPIGPLDVVGTGGSFSASARVSALFVQDHTNYRGVYLGYDNAGQIGIIAPCTSNTSSNLAFWNYKSAGGWFESLRITSDGNLGVGTANPGAVLTVTNHTPLIQLFDLDTNPADGSSIGKLAFGSGQTEWASIEGIRTGSSYDDVTQIRFSTSYSTGVGGDGNNKERMRLTPQGNLLINKTTQTNAAYKLDVNGNIRANQIVVNTTGADFVFSPSYRLLPLSKLNKFIITNHHLPEITPAKEMQVEGLNVGESQTRLLQKVEELTLYLIEKDKQVNAQQKELNQQEKKNSGYEKRIRLLETKLDRLMKKKR